MDVSFIDEMKEQPAALERLVSRGRRSIQRAAAGLQAVDRPILFLGMGSSYFAGLYGAWLLNQAGLPAMALEASMALHDHAALLSASSRLVLISQSGESPEVVELSEAVEPSRVIAITNAAESPLARHYPSNVLLLEAGPEEATTSKTYTNTLALLAMLGGVDAERLAPVPETIQRWLERTEEFPRAPQELTLIGRGPSLTSALQGALILREGAAVTATGFSGGGFRHGPMQWAENRDVLFFLGHEPYRALQNKLAEELASSNRKYTIGVEPATWSMPNLEPALVPIVEIAVIERMMVQWALEKGLKPGKLLHKVSRE